MIENINISDIIEIYIEPGYLYLKYSDIVESSKKRDCFNRMLIKMRNKEGTFTNEWCSSTDKIFLFDSIRPYALKFNPEKLI